MKDAALLDAMRGVLWESKFRGTLDELEPEKRAEIEKAARRKLAARKPTPWAVPSEQMKITNRVGWGTYGWKYDPTLVHTALEGGAGIIDTAEGYGFGRVETELGKALHSYGKYSTLIATKVARNHLSRAATESAAERSREKLGVESIDLYQIHWPVMESLESTMDAMAVLLERRTIKRVGVSNFCGYHVEAAVRAAKTRGFTVATNQVRFNRIDAGAADYLFGRCEQLGVGLIVYSPFAQGQIKKTPDKDLIWILSHRITAIIPATNSVEHLKANLACGQ